MAPRPSVWGPLGWVVVDIGMERVCFGPPAQPPMCNEHRDLDAPKVQNNGDRVRELWTGRPQPSGPGSVGHGPRSEGWRSAPSCPSTPPRRRQTVRPRQGCSQSPCEALSRPPRHFNTHRGLRPPQKESTMNECIVKSVITEACREIQDNQEDSIQDIFNELFIKWGMPWTMRHNFEIENDNA